MQRGPDESRLAQWEKRLKHLAADVLVADGTQWIEADKNEKARVVTKQAGGVEHVLLKLKCRLVALYNHWRREVRSDSPCVNLVSSRTVKVQSGDMESAYCAREHMSRVWLLRQPRSGGTRTCVRYA